LGQNITDQTENKNKNISCNVSVHNQVKGSKMFGRADFERFFTVGKLVILALFILLISVVVAFAEESSVLMKSVPVVCLMDTEFEKGKSHLILQWQGLTGKNYLTQMWHDVGGKGWMITQQKADNPLICILSAGEDNEFVGEEARL
jgi:hypothetical protein